MEGDLSDGLHCAICLMVYDTSERIPMLIPCKNGHTICSKCISTLLTNDNMFRCPFDKVEIFRPAMCSRNIALLHFLEYNQKYKVLNGFQEACDMLCINCEHKIDSIHHKDTFHKGHDVITQESFEEKIFTCIAEVEKGIKQIGNTENTTKSIKLEIELKKKSFCDTVDQKINECIKILTALKEKANQEIANYFDKLRVDLDINISENTDFSGWVNKTKKKLLYNSKKVQLKSQFKILNQFNILKSFNLERWLESKNSKINEIQKQLSLTTINMNSDDSRLLGQIFIEIANKNKIPQREELTVVQAEKSVENFEIKLSRESEEGKENNLFKPRESNQKNLFLIKHENDGNMDSKNKKWIGQLFDSQQPAKNRRNYGFFKKDPKIDRLNTKESNQGLPSQDEADKKRTLFS